jgi:hypothetical protein
MYLQFKLSVLFLFASMSIFANAQLALVGSALEAADTAYGQIINTNGSTYWLKGDLSNGTAQMSISNFFKEDLNNEIEFTSPYFAIVLVNKVTGKNDRTFPLVGLNDQGIWQIAIVNFKNSKIIKQTALTQFSLINGVESYNGNYYIIGMDFSDKPLLSIINMDTLAAKNLNLKSQHLGEASNILVNKNGILILSNYRNATSDLQLLQTNGNTSLIKTFAGGAATGLILKDGIAITYRLGSKIFVEKFNNKFESIWNTFLYDISGSSTKKNTLISLPNGLAYVGGVNSHLKIIRLNESGQIINTTIDSEHEFLIPPIGMYSAAAEGNLIHIRGQARRAKNPESNGKITTFHFIENFNQ